MKLEIDNGQQTGKLLSGNNASGSIVSVGESVKQYDLLYLCGLAGKGFKVDVSDFAAVGALSYGTPQTNAASGQIVAQTAVATSQTNFYPGASPMIINADGDIFVSADGTSGVGVRLSKFSSAGSLIDSVSVAGSGNSKNHCVFELSNGNIAVVYAIYALRSDVYIAVYDKYLNQVKAATLIGTSPSDSYYFGAVKLSAGGFAVIYQDNTNILLSRIVTFDNSGNVSTAAFTVHTRTSSNSVHHAIAQLSNGNLAFAVSVTNATSGLGLYYGVFTTAGAQVFAATQIDSVNSVCFPQLISSGAGNFAIARPNGTNQKAWIFNNAGTLQGTEFSSATTAGVPVAPGQSGTKIHLLWDGTDFYLIWHRSTDSKCVLTRLPITGTGYSTTIIPTGTTQYDFFVSAFYKDGFIVAASMSGGPSGNAAPAIWIIDVSKRALVSPSVTTFGVVPGAANGQSLSIIDGGDRAFIAMYGYANTAATNLCVGKWSATTVIGVSSDNGIKDSAATVQSKPGTYKINGIKGSRFKGYDMTLNAMVGGKGAIMSGGAITITQ